MLPKGQDGHEARRHAHTQGEDVRGGGRTRKTMMTREDAKRKARGIELTPGERWDEAVRQAKKIGRGE